MKSSRHLLHDLTETISSSSVVRLLTVSLMDKNRLALIVGAARFRKTCHQSRKNKRLRLVYLDGLEVAGATRGPEGPPWEPKTPRQD